MVQTTSRAPPGKLQRRPVDDRRIGAAFARDHDDLPIVINRSITLLGGAAIGHPVRSCKPAVQSLHSPNAARGFTLRRAGSRCESGREQGSR